MSGVRIAILAASVWLLAGRAETALADELPALVRELGVLVDEAERARAADPRLITDLRRLIGRYDNPYDAVL